MSAGSAGLEGRVAVVTGAASGIGRATVERFLASGASVVAVDLEKDGLAWAADPDAVLTLAGDVTREETNQAMVEQARQRFGRLDAVVLNAGIGGFGAIDAMPLETLDRTLDVNLRGVVLGIRAAVPVLRSGGGGAIVATASVSGLGGDPNMWAYNASKGGVVNLVRATAIDLARDGIRVCAVCPGPIHTGMTRPIRERAPELHEELRSHIPLQRWGEADEVAAAICFLSSPQASFITGVALPVDGGVTASTGQFDVGGR